MYGGVVTNGIPFGLSLLYHFDAVNFVTTMKGGWWRTALPLTMNSVTTLMTSHNCEGRLVEDGLPADHELCHHTDDVTQH